MVKEVADLVEMNTGLLATALVHPEERHGGVEGGVFGRIWGTV